MLKIQSVKREKDGNRFCGPAAVSAITGLSTNQAALLFREYCGHYQVKGTSFRHMSIVLAKCGIHVRRHLLPGHRLRDIMNLPGVYLVAYDDHWAIAGSGYYVCGRLAGGKRMRQTDDRIPASATLTNTYELAGAFKVPGVLATIENEKKLKRSQRGSKAKCTRIANAIGAEIDIPGYEPDSSIGVFPPDGMYASEKDDPYFDDHYACNWEEALERAEAYQAKANEQQTIGRASVCDAIRQHAAEL